MLEMGRGAKLLEDSRQLPCIRNWTGARGQNSPSEMDTGSHKGKLLSGGWLCFEVASPLLSHPATFSLALNPRMLGLESCFYKLTGQTKAKQATPGKPRRPRVSACASVSSLGRAAHLGQGRRTAQSWELELREM